MTADVSTAGRRMRSAARPGSLVSPFLRHALILAGVAALAFWLRLNVPTEGQALVWIGAGLLVGLLAGLVGGGWVGLLFLPLGAALGVIVELHLRVGPGAAALAELRAAGPTLLAAGAALVLAYAVALVGLLLLGRRSA